jgi:methylamine utilization protein MauE
VRHAHYDSALFALALRFGLAAVLAIAAVLKFVPDESVSSPVVFGLVSVRARWVALAAVGAVELALATGVAAGSEAAAYAAAGLLLTFGLVLVWAIRAGRRGLPCPCFGRYGRIGPVAVVRNVALSAALAALPAASSVRLSPESWLAIGLGVALTGVAALTVAVLALAREVGMLGLRLPPGEALEVLSEGPEIGRLVPIVDRFSIGPETRVALAVFSAETCRLCRSLEPAVAALARDAAVAVEVFDEERDRDAWEVLAVPGSPYAVAIDLDATVRAKGTFNSLAQLESIVAAALRRGRPASTGV